MRLKKYLLGFLLASALVSCTPKTFSPTTVTLQAGAVGTNFVTNFYRITTSAYAPPVTGLNNPMDICFDTSGNYYVCDAGNNLIKKYNSSDAFVTSWGSAGSGLGQFNHPAGIVYHPSGYIFVSDRSNNRIQRFLPDGTSPMTFGSVGTGNTQFKEPVGLAVDKFGYLYVCDLVNCRVMKYDVSGTYQNAKFGSLGSGTSSFSNNSGIAINDSGYLFLTDNSNYRLSAFNDGYNIQWTYGAGQGSSGGQFDIPWDVSLDSSRKFMAISDMNNNRFHFYDYVSSATIMYGSQNGSAGAANNQFTTPRGLSMDLTTNVYICDAGNNRICKWNVLKMTVQTNIITNQI